jgi:FkbM family methyltransferase
MMIKDWIRSTLNFLHIDLTKNLQYDRLTTAVFKHKLNTDSNCVDVGCHKGEILDLMIKYAPKGEHYGFEPIPILYKQLADKYNGKAKIINCALADSNTQATFNYVKNDPAYSGLQKRQYDRSDPIIEQITVDVKPLDTIIPETLKVDLIKIDVEGGEFGVLKGATRILKTQKPILIFESGKGASDYYGTKPEELYEYLVNLHNYTLYTLPQYFSDKTKLSLDTFVDHFNTNKEYYFVGE